MNTTVELQQIENVFDGVEVDTPKAFTPKNVEFTKEICSNKSVKVVLVDYPTPIDY
ncbi:MAG: hypothetical protein IKU01_02060 [Bacteroidales bacterium]|nr:hypothetical protein [Bacteroidales bacterium]